MTAQAPATSVTAPAHAATEFEREALPHVAVLHRAALRLTRNQQAAEDLVQDTLERAYRHFARFQGGTNIRSWLLTIMRNIHISRCRRKEGAVRVASLDATDDPSLYHQVAWVGPSGWDVEASVVDHLAEETILTAIDALPAGYRAVVRLADVEGLACRAVSDTLGIPLGTVMSRLFRGRRRLRHALRDEMRPVAMSARAA